MKKLLFLLLLIPAFGFAQLSDATLLLHDSTQIKQLGTSQLRSWQMFKEVIQSKVNVSNGITTSGLTTGYIPYATSATTLGNSELSRITANLYGLIGITNSAERFSIVNSSSGSNAFSTLLLSSDGTPSSITQYGVNGLAPNRLDIGNAGGEITLTTPIGSFVGINITPSRELHVALMDATTNSVGIVQRLTKLSSGTAAIGIGSGLELGAVNSVGLQKVGSSIESPFTSVANTNESADFVIKNISTGTLTERLRVTSAGAIGLNGANYGTAGDIMTSGGGGAAVSWTSGSALPYWPLTGTGTLTGNFILNGGSHSVKIGDIGGDVTSFTVTALNQATLYGSAGLHGFSADATGIKWVPDGTFDAQGDTYYRLSTGYIQRIPIGANTYVLTSNGTIPSWQALPVLGPFSTVAAGYTNLSGSGSILKKDNTWLALGSALQVLRVNAGATDIEWGAPSSGTVTTVGALSPLFTTANATTTPTFTAVNQNANLFYSGPSSGSAAAPTFRGLVAADIPAMAKNTQIANYTLAASDDQKLIEMNNASSLTFTIAPNSSVAISRMSTIVQQFGAGIVTITLGTGVTGRSSSTGAVQVGGSISVTTGQNTIIGLYQRATDDYDIWDGAPATGSSVTSVNGTTNRITSTGGTTPAIDISASYVGQSSITTLGTVGTGTWQGTVVGATYGGTGVNNGSSTTTLGGNFITSGANPLTLTTTGSTNVTLPTSGTLVNTAVTTLGSLSLPESQLSFTDITTNNVSITKHGFAPKAPNDATKYLDGTGAYTIPSASGAAWALASGGALSGANTITGSITNTVQFVFPGLNTTLTEGAGIWAVNNTLAALGAQQQGPAFISEGRVWTTAAGGSSKRQAYAIYTKPFQNSGSPQADLIFSNSLDGAAYGTQMTLRSGNGGASGFLDLSAGVLNNSGGGLVLQSGGVNRLVLAVTSGNATWTQSPLSSAWAPAQTFNLGAHTAMTASTPFPNIIVPVVTQTWADGTVADQSSVWIKAPTWNGTTTLATFTIGSNLKVDAPIAGAKGAITDNDAIWSNGNLKVSGNMVSTGTATKIAGTATNDAGAAGNIGETATSSIASGSATSLTTATAKNVTSISLTAGDWWVEGNVNFAETTSTVTARSAGISSTTATIPTDGTEGFNGTQSTVTSETNSITLSGKEFRLSGTTTVFLVGSATFSAGTCAGFGTITAVRIR